MFEPDDVIDPAVLPANPEYMGLYLDWRTRIENHGADPLNEMLGLLEEALWDAYHAGTLSLDAVHNRLADARALATAAEDLAREA